MLLVSPFIRNAIFKVVSCTLLQLKHMLLPINLTTIIASSQKRNFGLSILVENWNLIISLSPQTISNPFEDRLQMKQVIYCRFMKTQNQFMRISEYYRIWTILILKYYQLLQLFYLIKRSLYIQVCLPYPFDVCRILLGKYCHTSLVNTLHAILEMVTVCSRFA